MSNASDDRFLRTLRLIAQGRLSILEVYELVEWVVDFGREPEDCFSYSEAQKEAMRYGGPAVGRET